jgi:hypothetical protein
LQESASRLSFGSPVLGLDPFSCKELGHKHRRREGMEIPNSGAPVRGRSSDRFTSLPIGRIFGDRHWPD